MKKLCYFINTDWYFELHWFDRAKAAQAAGFEVHVVSHFTDPELQQRLESGGFHCHDIPLAAESFNPINFIISFRQTIRVLRAISPDLLHCVTIKPCLIGGWLAKQHHKPAVLNFVGLGRVFNQNSLLMNLLRRFTVQLFKHIATNPCCSFMFEHQKDRQRFCQLVGLDESRSVVIEGAGIDPDIYQYSIEQRRDTPVVLFASRMLWSKGLGDLVQAKQRLRAKGLDFMLNVAGILVERDKDAISLEQIMEWHRQGLINWLGRSNEVYQLIQESNIVALPSVYGEGIPRILLEASSVGRACISYDIGGCDSLIIDDDNGVIVRSNSVEELSEKLEFLLTNPEERERMGRRGRDLVVNKFTSKLVINHTLQTYRKCLG